MEVKVNIPEVDKLEESINNVWDKVDELRKSLSELTETMRTFKVEVNHPTDGAVG